VLTAFPSTQYETSLSKVFLCLANELTLALRSTTVVSVSKLQSENLVLRFRSRKNSNCTPFFSPRSRSLSAHILFFFSVCSENLAFSIHFTVPNQPPPAPVVAAPSPPLSPSKTSRGFRIFSSPKKKATPTRVAAAPPPTPDPFYDYVSSDGKLATASINFIDQVTKCRLKKARIVVPFSKKDPNSPRSCGGALTLDLLFVPSVPGVPKNTLAKSMDEVSEGLERADWATKVTHESVLTQLGGDCTVSSHFFHLNLSQSDSRLCSLSSAGLEETERQTSWKHSRSLQRSDKAFPCRDQPFLRRFSRRPQCALSFHPEEPKYKLRFRGRCRKNGQFFPTLVQGWWTHRLLR